MPTMTDLTTARDATLEDLVQKLVDQSARRFDFVAPAETIRSENGVLHVTGTDAQFDMEGVTVTEGSYDVSTIALEGMSHKLGIPVRYLKDIHAQRPDLFDANVNGFLQGGEWRNADGNRAGAFPDPRSFLLRCFRDDDDTTHGLCRAWLSDSYKLIDNYEVLLSCLDGIRDAGIEVSFAGCNLSERRMRVRIAAPGVTALAPSLLTGYRSPFDNANEQRAAQLREHGWLDRGDEQTVFAGFDLNNSETGGGAFTLTPVLIVKVCRNGLKMTGDALRSVHLGSRLDDGIIRWSNETQQKIVELVRAQTRDAVTTFLDADYVNAKVAELAEKANVRLTNPQHTIETVTRQLSIPEAHRATILAHFIEGGQVTAGGVMQAVSSAAQTIGDPDTADEVEAQAVPALHAAAALV